MALNPADFTAAARSALADPELRKNYRVGTQRLRDKRRAAFAGLADGEGLRRIGELTRCHHANGEMQPQLHFNHAAVDPVVQIERIPLAQLHLQNERLAFDAKGASWLA